VGDGIDVVGLQPEHAPAVDAAAPVEVGRVAQLDGGRSAAGSALRPQWATSCTCTPSWVTALTKPSRAAASNTARGTGPDPTSFVVPVVTSHT